MKLSPYRWLEVEIPLPPEAVVQKLKNWTNPQLGEGTFVGKVSKEKIHIARRIDYRNSFVPFLLGFVSPSIAGSRFRFRLGFHPLVLAFLIGLIPCAIWLWVKFQTFSSWVPALMVALPLAAAIGTYFWEGPKLLRKVADCLEIDPDDLSV